MRGTDVEVGLDKGCERGGNPGHPVKDDKAIKGFAVVQKAIILELQLAKLLAVQVGGCNIVDTDKLPALPNDEAEVEREQIVLLKVWSVKASSIESRGHPGTGRPVEEADEEFAVGTWLGMERAGWQRPD